MIVKVIRVGGCQEEDRVVSYAADEGIGIPKDEQVSVFECFFRVDSGLRRKTQGVGLGLFLVKAIITAQHSEVWLSSEPGKGATFYFALPAS